MVAIDPDGVPVCDGHVNEEKLAELVAVGTERPALDYKAAPCSSKCRDRRLISNRSR
jgi:hypothetical protein